MYWFLIKLQNVIINQIHFRIRTFGTQLNSSTIDELGEGAWKDGGASSTGAECVG